MRHLHLVDDPRTERDGGNAPAANDTDASLRVAFATQDMHRADAHFGSAPRFAIYEVAAARSRFVAALEFTGALADGSGRHQSSGEDRIGPKVEALRGCHLLFCMAIGGPSAAKLVNAGIHPVKLSAAEPIEAILERLRLRMSDAPPPWLRKAMLAGRQRSMDFLDD